MVNFQYQQINKSQATSITALTQKKIAITTPMEQLELSMCILN